MAVNSAKQDELQKEVPKRVTLVRMYSYLLGYKKDSAVRGGTDFDYAGGNACRSADD